MQEMQETWVQSLGWEDHQEEEMATHSSILLNLINLFLIGEWLRYSIVLVSAMCQRESAIGDTRPLPPESSSHLPPRGTELGCHRAPGLSSLCHTAHFLSYLFYIWWCTCFNAVLSVCPSFSPQLCPQGCSLSVHLHRCPTNRLLSAIFLHSIYICINIWCLFFSLFNRL